MLLIAAVLASAMTVVYAKHRSRLLFVELQTLQKARDAMNVDWERLQLEQSTWTTHGRIENIARAQLNMTMPQSSSVTVVRP
jgi:cell division protein FtsL